MAAPSPEPLAEVYCATVKPAQPYKTVAQFSRVTYISCLISTKLRTRRLRLPKHYIAFYNNTISIELRRRLINHTYVIVSLHAFMSKNPLQSLDIYTGPNASECIRTNGAPSSISFTASDGKLWVEPNGPQTLSILREIRTQISGHCESPMDASILLALGRTV